MENQIEKQRGNSESTANQAQIRATPLPFRRPDVLAELWEDFQELSQLNKDIGSRKRRVSPQLKFQVYIFQVRAQNAKGILLGLKDSDLDEITERLEKLESNQK
jgi:hypothetical protein